MFVCSGGGRDFMRVFAEETWGILREDVIGSAPGYRYQDGRLARTDEILGRLALGRASPSTYAYTKGAERSLAAAAEHGWTVVSMKHDWATASSCFTRSQVQPAGTVKRDCDGGEFWSWGPDSNVRSHEGPGQRDLVWAIDIGGMGTQPGGLVIDAASFPGTPAEILSEIDAILESIAVGHWG